MALGDDVFRVPASDYFDEGRFRLEVERIFHRLPLLLAPSAELPNPGDYKAMTVCGTPVLLVRGSMRALRRNGESWEIIRQVGAPKPVG